MEVIKGITVIALDRSRIGQSVIRIGFIFNFRKFYKMTLRASIIRALEMMLTRSWGKAAEVKATGIPHRVMASAFSGYDDCPFHIRIRRTRALAMTRAP